MRSKLSASEMLYMRVLFAVALIALGIAGIGTASADHVRGHHTSGHHHLAHRITPLVVYDYQPGVVVRAYWLAPWRNRHYHPTTGEKPESGRLEDLTANVSAPEPAESFHRSWSTSSATLPETPRSYPRALDLAPRAEQPPETPAAVKP
jgi:hypothetical protein